LLCSALFNEAEQGGIPVLFLPDGQNLFRFTLAFTLSFRGGFFAEFKAIGLGFFDFFDFLATTGMALGVAVMLLYVLRRWKFYKFQSEANEGATGKIRVYGWMKGYINYVYPVVLIVVFVCLAQMYF
jgi:SNF family Na+-dependent transporter